ncbi:linear amide C-N hydrolase [Legionella drancourtii]|uniref:Putative penicillin amidase n=1 Tax=Legionella drancourtii LLAP12 TaxID=658187 RepID=G9ETT6_9GAMM|nr:linear amide C-N hydrolase [Legionella drancourtii]EHL29287.1 putative penicillin amidase [Legionella drancourtii LLAP12]
MKKYCLGLFAVASMQLFTSLPGHACTDFRLKAQDGTLLITRSMEFGQDLKSNLRSSPRGRQFSSMAPNGKPGLNWKAKYGYLYLDGFGVNASFDGMNEHGLSFEYLYLPGETQYQSAPEGKEAQALSYFMFGDWVLSNFKTIDEVKQALLGIYVVQQLLPQLGEAILPAHASIYDASGKGIVVEFYNNQINVDENIGIMTNSPKYNWQVTNLRNYLNLSATNANPITQNGITYPATGQGSGAIGLPGDASPPSRFVKTAFMVHNVDPANNSTDLLNLAQHIINNVDLPAGYVRAIENGKTLSDTTEWVVFKDISHKIFYYRTYNDMTLRSIDMAKIDFSEGATPLKMPLVMPPYVMDVTGQLLKTKG